jgi:hypothetical protein
MSIESVGPSRCGSIDDQEMTRAHIFATIARRVQTHRPAKVSATPSFCACGNPVCVQCSLCLVGMCQQCDVLTMSPDTGRWSQQGYLATVGFGYRFRDDFVPGLGPVNNWKVASVKEAILSQSRNGDLLQSRNKVLDLLLQVQPNLRHACWNCVGLVLPEVAEQISVGGVCSSPACSGSADETCQCCKGTFCDEPGCWSSAADRAAVVIGASYIRRLRGKDVAPPDPKAPWGDRTGLQGESSFELSIPFGLCYWCTKGYRQRILEICTSAGLRQRPTDPERLHDGPPVLHVDTGHTNRTRMGARAENRRLRSTVGRLASEVSREVQSLVSDVDCEHVPWKVVDDRATTPVRAL